MKNLIAVPRRRWILIPIGLLLLASLPLAVMAASTGGVKIGINAENLSTADGPGDDGSVGDSLNLKGGDPSGTTFSSLSGTARFKPATGAVQVFNIDGSTPSSFGDLGQIRLTDSSRPGDHIDIGLASGLEVRVVFAGAPTIIRFSSGLDKVGVKIGIK